MPLLDDLKRLVPAPEDVTDADYQPYIDASTLIINENLVGLNYSDERLYQIQLYLAAHYATVSLEKGGLKESHQGQSGDIYKAPDTKTVGFQSTRFGQQAIAFDTSGTLAALSAPSTRKALFNVVPDDQTYPAPPWGNL